MNLDYSQNKECKKNYFYAETVYPYSEPELYLMQNKKSCNRTLQDSLFVAGAGIEPGSQP